jgi:hypothetical protein
MLVVAETYRDSSRRLAGRSLLEDYVTTLDPWPEERTLDQLNAAKSVIATRSDLA